MDDFQKLAIAWHELRVNGRFDCSLEFCTTLFRYASHGLLTSREPSPIDPRQMELSLQGGGYRRKVIRILAS